MQNYQSIELKSQQLREFGLNPNHWFLFKKAENLASLINIEDPELEFEVDYELNNQTALITEIRFIL